MSETLDSLAPGKFFGAVNFFEFSGSLLFENVTLKCAFHQFHLKTFTFYARMIFAVANFF